MQQINLLRSAYLDQIASEHATPLSELKDLLKSHLVGTEKICIKEAVALVGSGLAERVAPRAFETDDTRHQLVDLSGLRAIGPGVFQFGELVLFAHPFLRRSMSRLNVLNTPLLDRLQLLSEKGVPVTIALDPDMVGLASSYHPYVELQYWRGPKFNDEVTTIPLGLTRHEASDQERYYHGISRTEFWWYEQDMETTFEIEELRDIPWPHGNDVSHGCRFSHAIVGRDSQTFRHFDGAVRLYPEDLMIERLDTSLDKFGRRSRYRKLWRVDGQLDVPVWKELLSDYFRDNHLVGEYFGGESEEVTTISVEEDTEPTESVATYVPYSLHEGQGPRVAVSWHPREDTKDERAVVILDHLETDEGERFSIAEIDVVELQKIFWREGEDLLIPPNTTFVSSKDFYTNLPLIRHGGDDVTESLRGTTRAIAVLTNAWVARGYDKVASFSIGVPVDHRELRVSVMGHVVDLSRWFASPVATPPTTEAEVSSWCDQVTSLLTKLFSPAESTPIAGVLKSSGILLIQRVRVDATEMNLTFEYHDERGLLWQINPPEERLALRDMLKSGQLTVAISYIVMETTCSQCGRSYFRCSCSKLLDDGVHNLITKSRYSGAFWTDRPVW
jgi:hypothetical protein